MVTIKYTINIAESITRGWECPYSAGVKHPFFTFVNIRSTWIFVVIHQIWFFELQLEIILNIFLSLPLIEPNIYHNLFDMKPNPILFQVHNRDILHKIRLCLQRQISPSQGETSAAWLLINTWCQWSPTLIAICRNHLYINGQFLPKIMLILQNARRSFSERGDRCKHMYIMMLYCVFIVLSCFHI
jgi:hypothetical protein